MDHHSHPHPMHAQNHILSGVQQICDQLIAQIATIPDRDGLNLVDKNILDSALIPGYLTPGELALGNANLLGLAGHPEFFTMMQKACFSNFFADTPFNVFRNIISPGMTQNFSCASSRLHSVNIDEFMTNTTRMLEVFKANLVVVNVPVSSSHTATVQHEEDIVLCVIACYEEPDADFSHFGPMYDRRVDRATPRITECQSGNMAFQPNLSFAIPAGQVLRLFLYNLSENILQLARGSINVEDVGHTQVENDSLRACFLQTPQIDYGDNTISPNGFAQMTAILPGDSGTLEHELKDANGRTFLSITASHGVLTNLPRLSLLHM